MREYEFETCEHCGGTGGIPTSASLVAARLDSGKTQKRIADAMGISPQYLCDLENGRRAWNCGLVEEFQRALEKKK